MSVAIMAVATIISSSEKPLRESAARFGFIAHQFANFCRQDGACLRRIKQVVTIVIAVYSYRNIHQSIGDAAVDGVIGTCRGKAYVGMTVGCKISADRSLGPVRGRDGK